MLNKVVEWINRRITHPRDNEGDYGIRLLIHIPAGILIGLGLLSERMFLRYQRNEDKWTKDEAWKDIAGAMIGRVIGRIMLISIIVCLLWRWLF